jgi:hypothetical protein
MLSLLYLKISHFACGFICIILILTSCVGVCLLLDQNRKKASGCIFINLTIVIHLHCLRYKDYPKIQDFNTPYISSVSLIYFQYKWNISELE